MNKFRRTHSNNVLTSSWSSATPSSSLSQQEMMVNEYNNNIESRVLYPVLEEPEYMDESEEYTLETALERIIGVACSSSSSSSSMDHYDYEPEEEEEQESPAQQQQQQHHHHNHQPLSSLIWRGSANETMAAIAHDRIMCRECFMCHETVFGLDDAFYLICPRCHTYCPPTNHDDGLTTTLSSSPLWYGLALGMDIDTLWDCQAEILLLRRQQRPPRAAAASSTATTTTTTARRRRRRPPEGQQQQQQRRCRRAAANKAV